MNDDERLILAAAQRMTAPLPARIDAVHAARTEAEQLRATETAAQPKSARATSPAKKRPKKRGSFVVEESGVRVRVYINYGGYWLDARIKAEWTPEKSKKSKDAPSSAAGADAPEKPKETPRYVRSRRSAETTERSTAEFRARQLARELAKQQLFGVSPDTLTLGQLFVAYERHKANALTGEWRTAAETRIATFSRIWGDSTRVVSLGQTSVDAFGAARRTAYEARQRELHARKVARAAKAHVRTHVPPLVIRPLRDGALAADFRWLMSVLNFAMGHKLSDGKRLLRDNPLDGVKIPKENAVLRPVASHERYVATLAQTHAVDPMGRLALALTIARYTARRVDAILHLRASDLLLSVDRIRAALARIGADENTAELMTFGAILWRAESDKMGQDRVTPISQAVRAAIDGYMSANPRVGDVPLMPSVPEPSKPLTRTTATKWLLRAESLAGVTKLRGGTWHCYRRLWATERKHLPDVDVAAGGGWGSVKVMKASYQQATPSGVLAAVLG